MNYYLNIIKIWKRNHFMSFIIILLLLFLGSLSILKLIKIEGGNDKKRLITLPRDYNECGITNSPDLINKLACVFVVKKNSNLYQECINQGGATYIDSDVCTISYYNLSFNEWPKNYKDCVAILRLKNPDVCDITIPGDNKYLSMNKGQYNDILMLRDRCIRAGGKVIDRDAYGKILNPTLCYLSYRETN